MSDFDLSHFLSTLPVLPGVYRMLAADGAVLYVGKAVNLKRRVSGYFHKNDHSPRIVLMIKQVARVEITVTRSEAEALILENNLIKSLSPKYNILFRDDKSYPYLKISGHAFPQIAYHRGSLKVSDRAFGPYPNSHAVREGIETLQKAFGLRTCEDSVFAHRQRPCLLFQIKRCCGPCTGETDADDYAARVRAAADFLDGRTDALSQELHEQMQQAAAALDFEAAARYRDRIQALGLVQSRQFIDSRHPQRAGNIDVLAVVEEAGAVCLNWTVIRGGRHAGDKNFIGSDTEPQAYAEAFVAQHYLDRAKPDVLVSNFRLPESLCQAINSQQPVRFVRPERGEKRKWLEMAEHNARIALSQQQQHDSLRRQRADDLAQLLGSDSLNRLECFDISHTQGEATVASCVVYEDLAMRPEQYRRYNIATAKAGDDYAAMREVLTRRYGKLLQARANGENAVFPDAVLIDGGTGQINVALAVWAELGLQIPLVGIAKGVERKAGLEELILPFQNQRFRLPENRPALHLLQTVRDEAHRFAITGHRKKRDKARLTSALDEIDGIGAKRKKALLTRFGSLRGVTAAGVDEIAQTEGISRALAEKIYAALHGI